MQIRARTSDWDRSHTILDVSNFDSLDEIVGIFRRWGVTTSDGTAYDGNATGQFVFDDEDGVPYFEVVVITDEE